MVFFTVPLSLWVLASAAQCGCLAGPKGPFSTLKTLPKYMCKSGSWSQLEQLRQLTEKTLPNSTEEKKGNTSAFNPQFPDLAESEFTGWSVHYNHKSDPRIHVQSMSASKVGLGEHRGKKACCTPTHGREHEYQVHPWDRHNPRCNPIFTLTRQPSLAALNKRYGCNGIKYDVIIMPSLISPSLSSILVF